MNLQNLLLKPFLFFSELYSKSPNIKYAFIIVVFTGYLEAGHIIIAARNTLKPNIGLAPILLNLIIAGFGIGLLTWVFAWIPIRLFSGIGNRHFEIAAWTLIPQLFNNLLYFILAIIFPIYVSIPVEINMDKKMLAKNMKGVLSNPTIHIFGYLTIAWSLYLVYFAVYSIVEDKRKAYLTAVVSACIALGLRLISSLL